jgi:hypothetical protein
MVATIMSHPYGSARASNEAMSQLRLPFTKEANSEVQEYTDGYCLMTQGFFNLPKLQRCLGRSLAYAVDVSQRRKFCCVGGGAPRQTQKEVELDWY